MMTKFFTNNNCDRDLDPATLLCKLVQDTVTPITCVKLYRNWLINEVATEMTKGAYILHVLHNFVLRMQTSLLSKYLCIQ